MKKFQSTINKFSASIIIFLILIFWQIFTYLKIIPDYMLPSPSSVITAFIKDFPILIEHSKVSLLESFLGLSLGVSLGFIISLLMESNDFLYNSFYPIIILTQTVPTVAIAPLLVLWFGYGIMPKVVLIVIVTFFPITIGILDGFKSVDQDELNLLKSMNASRLQILRHLKIPTAMPYFFAGLRVSASYSIVGAVIAEWLGGFQGLGVYMTRVKKSYSFDKMFAVIFLISFLSLVLMIFVKFLAKISMPWLRNNDNFKE